MKRLIIPGLAVALLGACTPMMHRELRLANRDNLARLHVGMPRAEALRIMGGEKSNTMDILPFVGETIANPRKRETLKGPNGDSVEVLYYYSGANASDADIGATPVVIGDGRVMGVGLPYLAGLRALNGYR